MRRHRGETDFLSAVSISYRNLGSISSASAVVLQHIGLYASGELRPAVWPIYHAPIRLPSRAPELLTRMSRASARRRDI